MSRASSPAFGERKIRTLRRFDKIFAVRVELFRREPERARALVEPWVAPGGTVRTVYDQPE